MSGRYDRQRRAAAPRAASSGGPALFDSGYSVGSRATVLLFIFALLAAGLLLRLLWVQVIAAPSLSKDDNAVEITPRRGTIYDRNGVVLATTIDAVNVFCHPRAITSDKVDTLANFLAENCGGEAKDYKDKITADTNFSYLYKGADASLGPKVAALGIEGLDYEETTKRVYPCGAVGSQIIGILNVDGDAISGLELYYDEILGGEAGEKRISYSKEGVPIPGSEQVTKEAVAGQDIVISVDVALQEKMETELALVTKDVEGKTGAGIVMDSATGEIYATSSSPTFDITDLSKIEDGATNLTGISTSLEPGSIFKPVVMLAALEEGTTVAGQNYWCPPTIKVDGYTISDSHDRAAEDMDTREIMANSSNVGMSLIAKDLGFENLYNKILSYQVTERTGIDYPGEASGMISDRSTWSTVQGYNISFGQGLTVTPIAMTRFYGALANDGVACQPHFLMDIPSEDAPRTYGTTQISDDVQAVNDLTEMMEAVVEEGTATAAQIKGYRVVGKTGTAETADAAGGYKKNIYNISFVGFLPDASTSLVCYVGATDVPGERKTVSAFRDIMAYAIDRYGITQK